MKKTIQRLVLDRMAHKLALETAAGYIDSASLIERENGVKWMSVASADLRGPLREPLLYLELRGAVVRHPVHKNWLRIVKPKAVIA